MIERVLFTCIRSSPIGVSNLNQAAMHSTSAWRDMRLPKQISRKQKQLWNLAVGLNEYPACVYIVYGCL